MKKRTEISELGEFGLIKEVSKEFSNNSNSTLYGIGDDAAVIDNGDKKYLSLISTDLLIEGVNFDLTYFPLRHLGYKTVVVGINDIYAMNGDAEQIIIALGISSKLSVEDIKEFYDGVKIACNEYGVDLVGGDTSASINGLTISVTAIGRVERKRIAYRNGAKLNDLICITDNLGASFMGLHLLEREKRVLSDVDNPTPKFEGYEYILERQLKPRAPKDIITALKNADIVPTSMIDVSDGLSSDLIHICKDSDCGARIYLNRIPIAKQTYAMADELNFDPVVAAMNGGDDNILLFTVPLSLQEQIMRLGGVEVIGHITAKNTGIMLTTPDNSDIEIKAQGHK